MALGTTFSYTFDRCFIHQASKTAPGYLVKCIYQHKESVVVRVIPIHMKLHEANVMRITKRIIATLDTSALASDIADRISHPLHGLNNWFVIKFMINRQFPAPKLCHVKDPEQVELVIIRQLLESMNRPATHTENNIRWDN